MKLGRLGVWYSTDKLDGSQLRDFVRTVENNGYSNLWYPESRGYESMSLAAWLLSCSEKLIIGSSIANIYARDSFTAQRALISLNALYGDRFVLASVERTGPFDATQRRRRTPRRSRHSARAQG